jgi:hypothetical protein
MLISIQIVNQISHEYMKVNPDIHKQMIELPKFITLYYNQQAIDYLEEDLLPGF